MSITLKLATSLDGRIATRSGESRWITDEPARQAVHRLRAQHDAVLVGIETALADDPELTVRLDGHIGRNPHRIVLDSRQRLPVNSKLAQSARRWPVHLVSVLPGDKALTTLGVKVSTVLAGDDDRPDVRTVVETLRDLGLERILVEGGGQVAASFLRAGLVDRLEWFRAPIVLGSDGRPGVGDLAFDRLGDAPRFQRIAVELIGQDLWERYERL